MPVPASMQDLAKLASSNSPAGSEAIGTSLDNYLRAISAILRTTYSTASAPIAAASTVDVAAADGESVEISGSATINSLGAGFVGCVRELRFAGICTLVHSNNIVLQRGNSATTAAGDVMVFRCIVSGQWKQVTNSDAVNTAQLNQAIEDALGAGGNYQVTPVVYSFVGDGVVVEFPIPGANVPAATFYDTALELTANAGDYVVQKPYEDFTIVIDPDDAQNSAIRFAVAPGNGVRGFAVARGYARPFIGGDFLTTVAPTVVTNVTQIVAGTPVDNSFHNTLVVFNEAGPVTVYLRKNTGAANDWQDGQYFSAVNLGAGQLTFANEDTGAIIPSPGFNPKTRGTGSVITATCYFPDGDGWLASGDLERIAATPELVVLPIYDRSALNTTNITTGTGKGNFVMPFGMVLETIANRGCYASLLVAQAAGVVLTVDVNRNGTSIISTKMTFDNAEKTTLTAATPPVYAAGGNVLAAGDEITVDVDQVGTALAKGLIVYLVGRRAS